MTTSTRFGTEHATQNPDMLTILMASVARFQFMNPDYEEVDVEKWQADSHL
jgi:hypothetical protein